MRGGLLWLPISCVSALQGGAVRGGQAAASPLYRVERSTPPSDNGSRGGAVLPTETTKDEDFLDLRRKDSLKSSEGFHRRTDSIATFDGNDKYSGGGGEGAVAHTAVEDGSSYVERKAVTVKRGPEDPVEPYDLTERGPKHDGLDEVKKRLVRRGDGDSFV